MIHTSVPERSLKGLEEQWQKEDDVDLDCDL